jgi:hypothetical protein
MRISIQEAIEDVDIAFQQVEYCLKANAFWEREGFTADQFVTDLIVTLPKGDLHFPTDRFAEKRNIIMITLKKVLLRSSGFGPWEPQKMDQKSLLRIDLN